MLPDFSAVRAGNAGDASAAGVYVTNEIFLYRVVGIAASDMGEMVELEDCYSLDVVRVPIRHFHSRRLRVVTTSGAALAP